MTTTVIHRIDDVIEALELIINQAIRDNDSKGYFASLYRRMTLAIRDAIKKGTFENGIRMEKLEVVCAKRYIDALSQYQAGQLPTKAWQLVFDCAKQNQITTIQHLLLGINAQVNIDLGIAASSLCSGQTIYGLRKDFETKNIILSSLIKEVQSELEEIWFPMRFIDKVSANVEDSLINFSIGSARKAAWKVAIELANIPENQHGAYIKRLDNSITSLGETIAHPSFLDACTLKLIKMTEIKEPSVIIELLNQ